MMTSVENSDNAVTLGALSRVRVVLVHTTHPGNIGAAARAMWTMGLSQLVLVSPSRFPAPEAEAMASGADEVLERARVVGTLSEALTGCVWAAGFSARSREFAGRVLAVRQASEEAARLLAAENAPSQEIALVFGTEMSGLSNEELAQCTVAATIPANPRYSSLNLAAAVQVAAYELRVALGAGTVWQAPRFVGATHEDIERLYAHAEKTLIACGFLNPERPKRLLPRLRRLFARAGLEREEVNILRGILAEMDALLGEKNQSGENKKL
ncbi:MAG: RNA methyltransferase [Proteobacteria bacterium]|nr:RNA methyltransferase [Pseudomonadota bacterium]MCL2307711.1 RNA methyltransferase [Pseudomonadota bacterium]